MLKTTAFGPRVTNFQIKTMELALSTPALLFSTASLLLLGFTNRFTATAKVIRDLHAEYRVNPTSLNNIVLIEQIRSLQFRVLLIRNMQFLGVSSLFVSILCMIAIYLEYQVTAGWLFGIALFMQAGALAISVFEITISIEALKIELSDMEHVLGHQSTVKRLRDVMSWIDRRKKQGKSSES
ncbi:hypothetical protein QE357_001345 [Siphonobacter sp. BAB-5404]|nr:hypothetical protein [Siphonobacter sp. SORGH_AS_0500]